MTFVRFIDLAQYR